MFSFFKKSRKDDSPKKTKNGNREMKSSGLSDKPPAEDHDSAGASTSINKELIGQSLNGITEQSSSDDEQKMCKNNQPSTPELAPEFVSIPLPKNAVNAAKTIGYSEVPTFSEKDNDPNDSKMCDPYVNGLRVSPSDGNRLTERRGSCVKPCGHGTTAILPRSPLQNSTAKRDATPPGSPIMEVKKTFRYTVNGIEGNRQEDLEDKKERKKLENLPVAAKIPNGVLENRIEMDEKNLINQEAKFQSQLNDLSKELSIRDAEATKLRFQMDELQRDVFAKSAGMDRLQTELNAANKEADTVRQKIRHLENELENYRKRNHDLSEEIQSNTESYSKYEKETETRINELEGVIKNLRTRIETLESQINQLKEEKEQLEAKHAELQSDRDEERKKLAETLETASKQKEEIEKKWKEDFEKLRTVNIVKEQDLLNDFEWKLREVQQTCKKKLDDKEQLIEERLQEAYREAEERMEEAEKMLGQVEALKSYESEVQQLRTRTSEQEKALQQMRDQQGQMMQAEANLKNETKRLLNLIEMEKENIQHVQRIHRQELLDKERKLKDTLNQKRTEIAMYWEDKLLTECGRLKDEMEQLHNEEKYFAMEAVRKQKEEEFQKKQNQWETKLKECLKEIESLKKALDQKDEYYHDELIRVRSNTDRDIMELRRLMDKIDMTHHDNYEKLVMQHDEEIEKINRDHEVALRDMENHWKSRLSDVTSNLENVKEQLEKDAEKKMEALVEQHRHELDSQWENLKHQKSEAVKLVEDEYVSKYRTLEDQLCMQQKSSSAREIELLKAIDTLKHDIQSKDSTIDDLQNSIETLEGGVQVLNHEIAQQTSELTKSKTEAEQKIRSLHESIAQLLDERDKEREAFRLKYMGSHKQSQETIDHLQRKVTCLTKLFEEVRQRYERRESRQEDLNIISDLKQVIAEQEKDLACINEEKRYFQMRLMQLEKHLEQQSSLEDDDFEDAESSRVESSSQAYQGAKRPNFLPPNPNEAGIVVPSQSNGPILIPPTIPEGDE
ncbi:protein FAM184A-like isoform X2 [Euwallacea fornicatus]|uniref:protein FAM184A-like isoform X2 n=1 Tax=Euwallacea fornicatus TaxID=995702 RepID=UPI00338E0518